jgi:signal transduction histidine kinase
VTRPAGAGLSLPAKVALIALGTQLLLLGLIVALVGGDALGGARLAILGAALAVPVAMTYGITRFLVGRLTLPVVGAYERLAAGDFAVELPTMTAGKDFLGLRLGFRTMAVALERTLAEVKRADRERRRLFADLAHELATPTTTLIGIAAALRADAGDRARLLDHLERESARLERLVADVRELAILEDPALAMRVESCDVGGLATAAADRIRIAHPELTEVRCAAPSTTAIVDPIRVDQILTNLLGNAARHAGGGAIEVAVSRTDADVIVRVEDAGPGVPDALLPELGRRLRRVDPSRSRDTGGHGLGLAIVRAIAERHGGAVRFGRAHLGGLAVEVRLPVNGDKLGSNDRYRAQLP